MADSMRYIGRLIGSIIRRDDGSERSPRARRLAVIVPAGVVAMLATLAIPVEPPPAQAREFDGLETRAEHMRTPLGAAENLWQREIGPIDRVLRNYRNEPELTRRIAAALVREARRTNLEPRLLLAVLLVENPYLDVDAESFVGAQGLMQVMPFHLGAWPACGDRLDDIDSNVCHGAEIFASYLASSNGDIDRALLRYNGCVRGTNTPNCHMYPENVYARAGRASLLAWYRGLAGMAASP